MQAFNYDTANTPSINPCINLVRREEKKRDSSGITETSLVISLMNNPIIPNTTPTEAKETNSFKLKSENGSSLSTHLSIAILHLGALLRVDAGSQERRLPGVDFILSLARQFEDFEILVDIPVLRIVDGKHVAAGHESGLDVSQLQGVKWQHEFLVTLLRGFVSWSYDL